MRRALGKGLSQLIADQFESTPTEVELGAITPNERQPRTVFSDEALRELAASIREHGILQPLIVRPSGEGRYELIAGERRLRAATLIGLERVPIVIRPASNQSSLELALIENLQREDINPMECARAYRKLMDEFDLTQEQVAERVGKSRTVIANAVRLLRLPKRVQDGMDLGLISEGHAKALLSIEGDDRQLFMYDQILERNLTVRDVEKEGRAKADLKPKSAKSATKSDPNMQAVQESLSRHLGAPVRIEPTTMGGMVNIRYFSDDDLQRILEVIGFSL